MRGSNPDLDELNQSSVPHSDQLEILDIDTLVGLDELKDQDSNLI